MPLQSSGIIVVDKTSVISSQSTSGQQLQQQPQSKNSVITATRQQQQQYINSGGGAGIITSNNIGTVTSTQYKKQPIQQPKIIYGISNISAGSTGGGGSIVGSTTAGSIIGLGAAGVDENPIIHNTTAIKSSMRRHQRIVSTSSSPSSLSSTSSSQHIKQQFSPINQNFNQQMNQINQPAQQQQHIIQSTGNQVIVSEEYIEQGAQIVNISANDLLNPQIIKLVSSDGNGQNVLIDSLGNLTTTNGNLNNHHHQNSKLVVSNLTVLSSKQQQQQQINVSAGQTQQQQINFVNAKQIPYLTKNQTVQKIVNIPLKSNNILKNQHQQQQQTISGGSNIIQTTGGTISNAGQIVQKITMPRNVQVVARVQTVGQNQQQQQQQQQANTNQLIMQQKYLHNINGGGNNLIAPTNNIQTKINNNTNMIKKQNVNQMKVQQHKLTNLNNVNQQQVKTFIHQQQAQQQQFTTTTVINHQNIQQQQIIGTPTKQIKSQKIIKQFNNNLNNTSTTTLTLMQQQQHLTQAGTYTINNKINNMQIHHQQQQQKILSGGNTSSKSPNTNSTKYVMQNHIVIPSNTATTNNSAATNQNLLSGHNKTNNNSIVVNQQIINTMNNNICTASGAGNGNSVLGQQQPSGTIKFVNAHGTVLQQQQQSPTIIAANQPKIRQNHLSQQQFQQQIVGQQQSQTTQFLDNNSNNNKSVSENVYHIQTTTYLSPQQNSLQNQQQQSSSNSPITDDIVIVNGTQMTDELSARILQSMKSFGNQRQYQQQQQQQQKNIHTPTSPISVQQQQSTNILVQQQQQNIVVPREYPIYTTQNVQQQYPTYQPVTPNRQANQPSIRSHMSLEKKNHNETKKTTVAAVTAVPTTTNNIPQPTICVTGGSGSVHSSSEFFRVNSNEIHKNYYSSPSPCNTTVIDNIPLPLPLPRGDNTIAAQQAEHDDDIIGEEIRPVPVTTHDLRLQALHAFLQDHTYVAPMPTRLPNEMIIVPSPSTTAPPTIIPTAMISAGQDCNYTRLHPSVQQSLQHSSSPGQTTTFNNNNGGCIQTSKMIISDSGTISTVNNTGNCLQSQTTNSGVYVSGNIIGQNVGLVDNCTSGGLITQQSSSSPGITQSNNNFISGMVQLNNSPNGASIISSAGVYSFAHNVHQTSQQLDDDANSVISNDSRNNSQGRLEMDLGEETETAPEAEAEDDSITRCICDLTHDDGYMICCDKCSVWQHVDCMGIDRQNIPDEYLCEICQPRDVDKGRARSVQLAKRKEQAILMNAQLNTNDSISSGTGILNNSGNNNSSGVLLHTDINGQLLTSNHLLDGKINLSGSILQQIGKKGKQKKSDLLNSSKKTNNTTSVKKERVNVKRKETKRVTKRKSKNSFSNSESKQSDKNAENLRQWIENYEVAVTNHYSPELRARLHAITKQPNQLHNITAHENKWLKNCQNMDSKGTTIPHAGGKILISNFDILPNSAIVELRGKYMLTTQYKIQNPSVNMNSPPPPTIQTLKNHKTPGPFIFFYQLPVDSSLVGGVGCLSTEICVDTRTYGNEARFVRRSCRPNAELQYSFEKGTIHLYIVSLANIMASTEITIRHEPYDLMALENVNYTNCTILPTSTTCACGLTKECVFGAQISAQQQQQSQLTECVAGPIINSTPPATTVVRNKTRKINILNGCLPEKKLKKNSNINRGRSTSSSGESNTGLLSPSINNNNFAPNIYNSSSISSFLHDSGVYTSSSSPSVSIPSPTNINHMINSPSQQQQQQQQQQYQHQLQQTQEQLQNIQQQQHQQPQQIKTQEFLNPVASAAAVTTVVVKKELIIPPPPPQSSVILPTLPPPPPPHLQQQHQIIKQQIIPVFPNDPQVIQGLQDNLSISSAVNSTNNVVQTINSVEISPIVMDIHQQEEQKPQVTLTPIPVIATNEQQPQQLLQEQPKIPVTPVKCSPQKIQQQQQNSLLKKTPSKSRTTSSSEDTSVTPVTEQPTGIKQRESRKLTREERKMEAIVRAFEKMEKNQQRKNELKNSKSTGSTGGCGSSSTSKRRNSTSPSPKRAKSLSQSENNDANKINQNLSCITQSVKNQQFQKKINLRKKKKKGNKTYPIQTASQRKRRRSRVNSNDSDAAMTSEDSTSMLSPPLTGNCKNNDRQVNNDNSTLPPPNCGYHVQQQNNNINEKEFTLMNDLIESQTAHNDSNNDIGTIVPIVDTNVNHAAGLLLAFANPTPEKLETTQICESLKSPLCEQQQQQIMEQIHSQNSQPLVSPACLLIEKALGLESFKLPPKTTKTKKSLMSDWLNQTNEDDENQDDTILSNSQTQQHQTTIITEQSSPPPIHYQNSPKGLETLVQAAMVDYRQNSSSTNSTFIVNHQNNSSEPPQHFNYVAKKVEAFISQSQKCQNNSGSEISNNSYSPNTNLLVAQTTEYNNLESPSFIKFEVPNAVDNQQHQQHNLQPLQLSSCSNSAAKKRWLRQAISEETDENAQSAVALSAVLHSVTTIGSAASNSPTSILAGNNVIPNGFTTPLKKRRVVVVRNDENNINSSEDLSLTKSGSDSSLSNEDIKIEENDMKLKEQLEYDDDVDILRSPSPSDEKIVADNLNLVKIEPEDISREIKIDVEKEESSSDILKKYENQSDTTTPVLIEKIENELIHEKSEDIKETNKDFIRSAAAVKSVYFNTIVCKNEDDYKVVNIKNEFNNDETTPINDNCSTNIKEYNSRINLTAEILSKFPQKIENYSHIDTGQLTNESSCTSILPKTEIENFESVSDEIADIQKKLHSFHTENIMILQSRNKKSKRILKSDGLELDTSSEKIKTNERKTTIDSRKSSKKRGAELNEKISKKQRHLNFDLTEPKSTSMNTKKQKRRNEYLEKNRNRRESSASSSSRTDDRKHSSEDSRDSKFSDESNSKKINLQLQQPIVPIISGQPIIVLSSQQSNLGEPQHNTIISSYIPVENYDNQTSASMQYIQQQQQQQQQIIQTTNQQVQNPQTNSNQLPPLHLPYYNTIYGKLLDNNKVPQTVSCNSTIVASPVIQSTVVGSSTTPSTASTLLFADYLDTKTKSYSTLGGYVSHSTLFGLNKSSAIINQNVITPVTSVSSTPNVDSNTMISPVSIVLQQHQQQHQNSSTSNNNNNTSSTAAVPPKILTKTASHDPRLNPILTAPEPVPTPKRKLSINEYRKRKQQSTESTGNSQEGDLNVNFGTSPNDKNYENGNEKLDRLKNDLISDSSKVQFSPAPTLLEQQQEILCERLKSLKQKKNCATGVITTSAAVTSSILTSDNQIGGTNTNNNNNFTLLHKNTEKDDYNSTTSMTTKSGSSFLLTKSNSFDSISSSSSSSSSCSSPVPTKNDEREISLQSQKDNIQELVMNQKQKSLIDAINITELREISKNISEMTTTAISSLSATAIIPSSSNENYEINENIPKENNHT